MDHDAKSDFIALLAAEARGEDIDTGPDTVYRGPSQKSIRRRKALARRRRPRPGRTADGRHGSTDTDRSRSSPSRA